MFLLQIRNMSSSLSSGSSTAEPVHATCAVTWAQASNATQRNSNLPRNYKDVLSKRLLKSSESKMSFNPANAPHWGGSWERMIREVKKILDQCMDRYKKFSDVEFQTFLTRAEAILNRRPIAFMDDGQFITPNDLINPAAGISFQWLERIGSRQSAVSEMPS